MITNLSDLPAPPADARVEFNLDPRILVQIKAHHARGTRRGVIQAAMIKHNPDSMADAIRHAIAEVYGS